MKKTQQQWYLGWRWGVQYTSYQCLSQDFHDRVLYALPLPVVSHRSLHTGRCDCSGWERYSSATFTSKQGHKERGTSIKTTSLVGTKWCYTWDNGPQTNREITNRRLDLLGSVSVLQCVVSVVVHLGRRANVRNHDRPAVPAQGVFQ